jgi:hypothetical protein
VSGVLQQPSCVTWYLQRSPEKLTLYLTKGLDGLEQLAADYQDREIRKLTRRVAMIEKQLQITPE